MRLARKAARESIVLLKNDGAAAARSRRRSRRSPSSVRRPTKSCRLLGNYYGTPARAGDDPAREFAKRSALANAGALLRAAPTSSRDAQDPRAAPLIEPAYPASRSRDRRSAGLKGEYFRGKEFTRQAGADTRRRARRASAGIGARPPTTWWRAASSPQDEGARRSTTIAIRWTGRTAPADVRDEYELVVGANDGFRLYRRRAGVVIEWLGTESTRVA